MNNIEFLEHSGVKKQKWGIRRFQYENGSYTPAGEQRYRKGKPSTAQRFNADRYSHDDGTLTYLGSNKFSKSEKFEDIRKRRKQQLREKNGVRHFGLSLIQATTTNAGKSNSSEAINSIGNSPVNDSSMKDYAQIGVNSVSMLFGGSSVI